jgi:hypothetical protein
MPFDGLPAPKRNKPRALLVLSGAGRHPAHPLREIEIRGRREMLAVRTLASASDLPIAGDPRPRHAARARPIFRLCFFGSDSGYYLHSARSLLVHPVTKIRSIPRAEQQGARAMKAGHDRPDRYAGYLGDIAIAELVQLPQYDRLA